MFYVQCPVCGELIARENARATIRFDRRLYYLCSLLCRNRFVRDSAAFLPHDKTREVPCEPGIAKRSQTGGC